MNCGRLRTSVYGALARWIDSQFVSIRFLADNDRNSLIVVATRRREPAIDFKRATNVGLHGRDDEAVLLIAAAEERILVSHDKRTIPRAIAKLTECGLSCPGALIVHPQSAPLRHVADTLVLIWADDRSDDWRDTVTFIPF